MLRTATKAPGSRLISVPRGITLPIAGAPDQTRIDAKPVARVGLLGDDYVGMKPTMRVAEGDRVKRGQVLFEDKKTEGVLFTAPAAGTVAAVNRGAKRKFLSIEIDVDRSAEPGTDGADERFETFEGDFSALTRTQVREGLVNAGLWPAFRAGRSARRRRRPRARTASSSPRSTPTRSPRTPSSGWGPSRSSSGTACNSSRT